MDTVSVKEARIQLAKLINAAQRGRGVAITRRGKTVAHLVPPPSQRKRLPEHSGRVLSVAEAKTWHRDMRTAHKTLKSQADKWR